ncbi:MAG: phosphotriesterase [Eudoraea sp.]|uniref:phosphotriesterase family protein n=1 Tax=Eudoraea sp. TaxID=1979955 RepID=UPI003C743B3D
MKLKLIKILTAYIFFLVVWGGIAQNKPGYIQDIKGKHAVKPGEIWLSHEHILVDFIGADKIISSSWNKDDVSKQLLPFLLELQDFNVKYFVDATPKYLGRDVHLLQELADKTGMRIITNTGLYGAQNNKFIPDIARRNTAEELAQQWLEEVEEGIDGTTVKPGFIKISVDNNDSLSPMHEKLVKAAALCHLKSGLTIASHTGKALALWPQLEILSEQGVSPKAFIWVHAQAEEEETNLQKAAKTGCWISLDGLAWEMDKHIEKLLYAKRNGFLDQILISHDAGWYDPQKKSQNIQPYTTIFKTLLPLLRSKGFTEDEINLLISVNPSKAYAIHKRSIGAKRENP